MTGIIINEAEILQEFPADYTILDIETTGLSPYKCEIIELSAIKVRNDCIVDKFSSLVKPDQSINSFITGLTGITNDMVESAPDITAVLPEFMKFIENDCVLGHNVSFDIRFIAANLKKHFSGEFKNSRLDTMYLSKRYCTLPNHKLESLANHYNVNTKGHHRAMNDCMMTFEVYKNIKNDVINSANEVV